MIELWGMTEMVRVLGDTLEPRQVGTRAFGRAVPGIEVRVVDDADRDVPDGQPGEMLVRHSAETPRRGCFSGYLKDERRPKAAWRGGWFHTGDVVWRGPDGMLHFVERKKNIIRRSGENIAAAEVEAVLLTHPDVQQVAVMAVQDELRDEEVLACVVLKRASWRRTRPRRHCSSIATSASPTTSAGLGPHRASLPTTGTQKIQKHNIYPADIDPRSHPEVTDMRTLKLRQRAVRGRESLTTALQGANCQAGEVRDLGNGTMRPRPRAPRRTLSLRRWAPLAGHGRLAGQVEANSPPGLPGSAQNRGNAAPATRSSPPISRTENT